MKPLTHWVIQRTTVTKEINVSFCLGEKILYETHFARDSDAESFAKTLLAIVHAPDAPEESVH